MLAFESDKPKKIDMAKNNDVETNVINLIGGGTEISGDIMSNSDIRVDGSVTGNLTTKGKLVVGESGRIKGEINCKNADVSGKIEGKIIVSELLTLKPSSFINGDISTHRLAIEPGAMFTGNCKMESQKSTNPFEKVKANETEKAGS